jgi:hypothetical protein
VTFYDEDIMMAAKYPVDTTKALETKYKMKVGTVEYHPGYDYFWENGGTLYIGPGKTFTNSLSRL